MCYCSPASLLQPGSIPLPGITTKADAHHLPALMLPTVLLKLGFILQMITGGRLILSSSLFTFFSYSLELLPLVPTTCNASELQAPPLRHAPADGWAGSYGHAFLATHYSWP